MEFDVGKRRTRIYAAAFPHPPLARPSLAVVLDPSQACSGDAWDSGAIRRISQDGLARPVALCRFGAVGFGLACHPMRMASDHASSLFARRSPGHVSFGMHVAPSDPILEGPTPFGVLVIATLVVQQGNWRHWQEGEWMGWQRFEGWDEAITELNRRVQPTDAICLAPFLIETRDEPFPLREPAEYYEFAVRSAYPLTSPSPCKILSNNVRHWPTELRQEKTNSVWICARSRLGPIVSQLRQLQTRDSKWPWKIQETLEFGRVQLIHLSRSETHIASP